MKRLYSAAFAALLMLFSAVASATAQNTSGDTAPGQVSTSGQSIQTSYAATIPETRSKGNARFPNQAIFGGTNTVQNPGDWPTLANPVSVWQNIPSIVLRPFGKKPTDNLDTYLLWTTPSSTGTPAARTYTIPDAGANANFVFDKGNYTIAGTWIFSAAPTVPAGAITAAEIQTGSAKRELLRALVAPAGGAVTVNGTVYFANLAFGRAGIVKAVTWMTHVNPVSGTNTIKVLKNGAAGNTMLNAASVSLNGAAADVAQPGTLTATGADLALAATDSVYCEYSAGTQGVVAKDVSVVVEFEPTDF